MLNRISRRRYVKAMKKFGFTEEEAKNKLNEINIIAPGVKVKLNSDKILAHSKNLSKAYIEFVETNKDKVFTAEKYENFTTAFTLAEDDNDEKWVFVASNLVPVSDN